MNRLIIRAGLRFVVLLLCGLVICQTSSAQALFNIQHFGIIETPPEDSSLPYGLEGSIACNDPNADPAIGSSYFVSSATLVARNGSSICSAQLSGSLVMIPLVNLATGQPARRDQGGTDYFFNRYSLWNFYLPYRAAVDKSVGACGGSANASAQVGSGVPLVMNSADGDCECGPSSACFVGANIFYGNQRAEEWMDPTDDRITSKAFTVPFSLKAEHDAARKSGTARIFFEFVEFAHLTTGAQQSESFNSASASGFAPIGSPKPELATFLRFDDWQQSYGLYANNFNPGPGGKDLHFVWSYAYVDTSSPSTEPWYERPSTLMVWDPDWFGSVPRWARADNQGPVIYDAALVHYHQWSPYVPLLKWRYPYGGPAVVNVSGPVSVVWDSTTTGDAQVILAKKEASTGNVVAYHDVGVPKPSSGQESLTLDIDIPCDLDDEILLGIRGLGSGSWVRLDDVGLQWTVTPSGCTDADGDGYCEAYDCDDVNPYCTVDCSDSDGDTYCVPYDCRGGDANIWNAPGLVEDLVMGQDTETLTWNSPADPGASAVRFDTLRSADPSSFTIGALCMEANEVDLQAIDSDTPMVGSAFFYQVRPENDCAPGKLRKNSAGVRRGARECTAPSVCLPAPSGLVGWWPGDGNATDIIGGNDATLLGAGFTGGMVDQAFSFSGVGESAEIGDIDQSLYSVSFWMRTPGGIAPMNTFGHPMTFIDGPGHNADVWLQLGSATGSFDNESLTFMDTRPGQRRTGVLDVTVFGWTHVALSWNAGAAHYDVYINGSKQNAWPGGQGHVGLVDIDNLRFATHGSAPDFADSFFTGELDEVMVFDRSLSSAEIAGIVNAGPLGVCKP